MLVTSKAVLQPIHNTSRHHPFDANVVQGSEDHRQSETLTPPFFNGDKKPLQLCSLM